MSTSVAKSNTSNLLRNRVSLNSIPDEKSELIPVFGVKKATLCVDEHDSNKVKMRQKDRENSAKRRSTVSFRDEKPSRTSQSKIPVRKPNHLDNTVNIKPIIKPATTFKTEATIENEYDDDDEITPILNPDWPKSPSAKSDRPFSPETECEFIMDEESPPREMKLYHNGLTGAGLGSPEAEYGNLAMPNGQIFPSASSDNSFCDSFAPNYSSESTFGSFKPAAPNMPNFLEHSQIPVPRARRVGQQKPVTGGRLCWPPPQQLGPSAINTDSNVHRSEMSIDFEKPSPTNSLSNAAKYFSNNSNSNSDSSSPLPPTTTTNTSSNDTDSINQLKYLQRCCCGCMRVTTGCVVIAVLELIYLIIQLTDTVYLMASTDRGNPVYFAIVFSMILLVGAAIFLLFAGIRSKRHQLLVPHILMQLLVLLLLVAIVAYLIMTVVGGTAIGIRVVSTNGRNLPQLSPLSDLDSGQQALQAKAPLIQASRTPAVVFAQKPIPAAQMVTPVLKLFLLACALFAGLLALVQIWLTSTVYQCYRYIRQVNMSNLKLHDSSVSTGAYSTNPAITTMIDENGRRNSLC